MKVSNLSTIIALVLTVASPLPARALAVGEAFRLADTLTIQRLADSAGLQRYRVERETAGRVPPPAGDSLTPPVPPFGMPQARKAPSISPM